MNNVVRMAEEMKEYLAGEIPDVEIGDIVELRDVWDGDGDCPIAPEGDGCSTYWLTGDKYIYYEIQLADVYSGDIRDLTEDEQLRLNVKIKNISIS